MTPGDAQQASTHQGYTDLVRARVEGAIAMTRALSRVRHPLTRGQLRELVIRDLLRPFLPMDVGLGTGEIVTAANQTSRQQDVVMFNRSVLPPITLEGNSGIFPVESVAYAIEIKSSLTEDELNSAHTNAVELGQMQYIIGMDQEGRAIFGRPQMPLVQALFALDTRLSAQESVIERYKRISGGVVGLAVLCVVGVGYWWRAGDHWHTLRGQEPFDEVLGFLGGTANSFSDIFRSRGAPRLGTYFLRGEVVDA